MRSLPRVSGGGASLFYARMKNSRLTSLSSTFLLSICRAKLGGENHNLKLYN